MTGPSGERGAVAAIHAVVLVAADFDGQRRFYGEVLGLEEAWGASDAVAFRVGTQLLTIFARTHDPASVRRLEGATHGLSHLEFAVHGHLGEELRARLASSRVPGTIGDNFVDADGNLFHFVQGP